MPPAAAFAPPPIPQCSPPFRPQWGLRFSDIFAVFLVFTPWLESHIMQLGFSEVCPMNTLTKEQIQKLTPEQQDAFGAAEAHRVQQQLKLLDQARKYHGQFVAPSLAAVAAITLGYFHASMRTWLVFGFISLWLLFVFHITGVNRRLDALLKLLEKDLLKHIERDDA
jgi:hypothetical protein